LGLYQVIAKKPQWEAGAKFSLRKKTVAAPAPTQPYPGTNAWKLVRIESTGQMQNSFTFTVRRGVACGTLWARCGQWRLSAYGKAILILYGELNAIRGIPCQPGFGGSIG
jgi:hypothetical protein